MRDRTDIPNFPISILALILKGSFKGKEEPIIFKDFMLEVKIKNLYRKYHCLDAFQVGSVVL